MTPCTTNPWTTCVPLPAPRQAPDDYFVIQRVLLTPAAPTADISLGFTPRLLDGPAFGTLLSGPTRVYRPLPASTYTTDVALTIPRLLTTADHAIPHVCPTCLTHMPSKSIVPIGTRALAFSPHLHATPCRAPDVTTEDRIFKGLQTSTHTC